MTKTIPNEVSKKFPYPEGKRELMAKYGNEHTTYFGENESKEKVELHISTKEITLKTYQDNGWVRVNYYDKLGCLIVETFEGRWR